MATHLSDDAELATDIQDAIEAALREARECDDTCEEAEQRVTSVLAQKFEGLRLLKPFRITEPLNFGDWEIMLATAGGCGIVING